MLIKKEDGTEIEVFTQEELDNKIKETEEKTKEAALEEFKAANPDKTQELEELKEKLSDAEAALQAAEAGDDDAQKKRLREERDNAKAELKNLSNSFEKKFDELRKEISGDTKTEMLDKLSNGNAELRKKIELEFDSYKTSDTTKKGIQERMEKAYQLATGNKPTPNFMDNMSGSSSRGEGGGYKPTEKKELSDNAKAIGNVLGISEADRQMVEKAKQEGKIK